jgi:hypothetical protein
VVPKVNNGPVPVMLANELTLARSGAILVHRLIWRNWNQQSSDPVDQPDPSPKPEPAGQK